MALQHVHPQDFKQACRKAPSIYLYKMPNADELYQLSLDKREERLHREKQKEKQVAHKILNEPEKIKYADPVEKEWAVLCSSLITRVPKPKRLAYLNIWCRKHEEWVGQHADLVNQLNEIVSK